MCSGGARNLRGKLIMQIDKRGIDMKKYQIIRRLKIAIDTLRVNDNYLLKNDVSERSIVHRLAVYLESTFGRDYHIDCEYNRDIENSKKVYKAIDASDNNDMKIVVPDIIIHRRGTNSHNLLAIEVKKTSNSDNGEYDYRKLKEYTNQNNALKYKFGIFIKFFVKQDKYTEPEIIIFENGMKL